MGNGLSGAYRLHKFGELLEVEEYCKPSCVPKSKEELEHQDEMWKKVCQYYKLDFAQNINNISEKDC